ncbi:hypothetical protein M3Y94_00866700 [Aphelenchoides besseyi]|nr:hypothetical protein M3Y94_00866700 [Aphelenchoides besseyi]
MIQHKNQATVAIGVRYGGRVRFFVIGKTKRARFHITEKSFDSIPLLIQHYSSTREPLTHDLPIVIKNAIPLPSYIITHDRIRLGTLIGKGAFGYVFKATLVCGQKTETVAVKSLKGKSTNDSRQRALFLQEARTMREYHHVNIVNFIGIASQQEPLMLILEFCVGGSLLNYLRNNGPELSIATRFRFATEAAAGLRYLERCRCIHRDIAARNCLLSDQLVCKISDFGLSIKDAGLSQDDPNSRMPVKWCSPEVLRYRQFSSKSDVWAYGVLLFEIFTDGSEPYGKMTTTEVRALLTGVTLYRMELPNEIPLNVKKLMCECFEEDPQHRPTMKQIHRQLCALKF